MKKTTALLVAVCCLLLHTAYGKNPATPGCDAHCNNE